MDLEKVKFLLSSTLISKKEGVRAAALNSEYMSLTGEPLPFRKFGRSSVAEFMASLPDVATVHEDREGFVVYKAVGNSKTAHIQKMISSQKSTKKRKNPIKANMRRPVKQYQAARGRPMAPRSPWQSARPQPMPRRGPMLNTPPSRGLLNTPPSRGPFFGGRPYQNFTVTRPARSPPQPPSRPAGASYATYETPPRFLRQGFQPKKPGISPIRSPAVQGKIDNTDYKSKLNNYAQKHSIDIQPYETVTAAAGHYVSSVRVKHEVYGSLDPFKNKKEAEQAAAKHACEKLGILQRPSSSGSDRKSSSSDSPVSKSVLKQRVADIVARRQNGLWHTRLPIEYKEYYKEDPPENLLALLEEWPDIVRIDKVPDSERKILYPVDNSSLKLTGSISSSDVVVEEALLPDKGSQIAVYLCHVVNPHHFYVQRADSKILEQQISLQDVYSKRGRPKKLPNPDVGNFCAAPFNGEWYRAQVISVQKAEKVPYEVQYVDYGNTEFVVGDNILRLLETFCVEPAQALRCSLYGVCPAQGNSWSADTTSALDSLTEVELLLTLEDADEGTVDVSLFQKEDNASVAEMLVKKGLARCLLDTASGDTDPPPLELPEDASWDVFVSYIRSTSEIIVRLIGREYSEKLDELEERMATLCNQQVTDVHAGMSCAAYMEDDENFGRYFRVRVISVNGLKAKIELPDHGDIDEVPVTALREIPAELNSLPYQGISCTLAGLENMQDNEKILKQLMDTVLGNTYVAVVKDRSDQICVTLFDTSTEEDVNINDRVLKVVEITELTPVLPKTGYSVEGIVSYVSPEGRIFFLIDGPGTRHLEKMGEEISEYYSQPASAVHFVSNPEIGKRCVCKFSDDSWYRVRIEEVHENRKVTVLYVDYGNRETVSCSNLREYLPSNRLLENLPFQAVECRLFSFPPEGEEWTESALNYLEYLVGQEDKTLLLQVVSEAKAGSPAEVMLNFWENDGMVEITELILAETMSKKMSSEELEKLNIDGEDDDFIIPTPTRMTAETATRESPEGSTGPTETEEVKEYAVITDAQLTNVAKFESCGDIEGPVTVNGDGDIEGPVTVNGDDSLAEEVKNLDTDFDKALVISTDLDSVKRDVIVTGDHPHGDVPQSPGGAALQSPPPKPSKYESVFQMAKSHKKGKQQEQEKPADQPSIIQPPPLQIPPAGEYFDVHIIHVFDPENFRCIPYESQDLFEHMLSEMEFYYQNESSAVTSVQEGDLYAYCVNNSWQRVRVRKLLPENQVAVNFVDRGDFNVVSGIELHSLPAQFRKLPYQAIKAKLAGVTPAGPAWSEEAIKLFRVLTLNKDLVGLIQERDDTLTMILTDTSTDADIVLSDILVQAEVAKSVESS